MQCSGLRLFTGAGIMLWYCEPLKGKSQRLYPLLCRNVDALRGCQPLRLSLLHFLPSSNLPLYLHSILSLFCAYIPVFCPFFILHSSVFKAHPNALEGRWNLCLLSQYSCMLQKSTVSDCLYALITIAFISSTPSALYGTKYTHFPCLIRAVLWLFPHSVCLMLQIKAA